MSGQEKGTEAEQRKTLKGIVAELRMGDDGGKPAYRIGRPDKVEISMPSGQPIRSMVIEEVHISELAEWIEAAAKREGGNAAALREAIEPWVAFGEWLLENAGKEGLGAAIRENGSIIRQRLEELRAALSAPARQCDVGNAEEQTERFKQLCRKYRRGPGPRANCKGCPVSHESQHVGCTFAWAQMPYSEGDK